MARAHIAAFFVLFATILTHASAEERLFVFHSGAAADLYDAESFQLLGSPAVGAGAIAAFGIPDPVAPGRFLKLLVLTTDSIVVVSPRPSIRVLATVSIGSPLNAGEFSAVLSEDSRTLIVIGGETIYFFDTLNPSNPAPRAVILNGRPTGIALPPGLRRAYVTLENSPNIRIINFSNDPPTLLAGPITLPVRATAIAALPNGGALLAAAPGRVFDISARTNQILGDAAIEPGVPLQIDYDPGAPVAFSFVNSGNEVSVLTHPDLMSNVSFAPAGTVRKAISPGAETVYMLQENGVVVRGNLADGATSILLDPLTNAVFPWPAIDIEAGARGASIFTAFGNGGPVLRLNAAGTALEGQITPSSATTGIAFMTTPGTSATRVEIYGGNFQFGTSGTRIPRPLAIRALDGRGNPVFDKRVNFSSSNPNVSLDILETRTDLRGVALTYSSVPSNNPFEVEARLNDAFLTIFELNTGQEGAPGLSKASGDYIAVRQNTALPRAMVVRAENSGLPTPGLEIAITVEPDILTCPDTVTTNDQGLASVQCTAGDTLFGAFSTQVEVQATDSFGRLLDAPFQVKVILRDVDMPRDPIRLTPSALSGVAGSTSGPNIIRYRVIADTGFPVAGVGLELTSPQDVKFPMRTIPSGLDGLAGTALTFPCPVGPGIITVTQNSPGLPAETIALTTTPGPADTMRIRQGNGQIGTPNARLAGPGQALRAAVTDVCGNPTPNLPVIWEVNPPGAATLENALSQTNNLGEVSAIVRFGPQAGPVAITARVGAVSTTFNLTITVVPTKIEAVSGTGLMLPVGATATEPIVVQLTNDSGTAAIGVPVEFRVLEGDVSLVAGEGVSDGQGRARVTVVAGQMVGAARIEARAGALVTVIQVVVIGRTPNVSSLGFVNGASFVAGWVPGSLGSIFGIGLMEGVDGVIQASSAPFPYDLAGVCVWVNDVPAPLISIANINGQEQINLQVPFETPAPSENVTVRIKNNGSTAEFTVRTLTVQPGIFEVTLPEGRFAAALHADFSLVSPANPARPGEVILLFVTGLGILNPVVGTNVPGPIPAPITTESATVTVAGTIADVVGAFYAPTLYTVYQINFFVPGNAASGNLALIANIRGSTSRTVLIPVAR